MYDYWVSSSNFGVHEFKIAQIVSHFDSAAKILPLLSSALPRVLIVEEAGECLESHVVVNLVPSIQHTILIGDHLQLRPQIACYGND